MRYEGTEESVLMRSSMVSPSDICCALRAEGVHSLQVPRQARQTPFAPRAGQSAQQELPEFHDVVSFAAQGDQGLNLRLRTGLGFGLDARIDLMSERR